MNNATPNREKRIKPPAIERLNELLQEAPIHSPRYVELLFGQAEFMHLDIPHEIRVHCDECGGGRRHTLDKEGGTFEYQDNSYQLIGYTCEDCTTSQKVFGLKSEKEGKSVSGICTKIYQEPPFGEPIPKRLFQVIGEEN